MVATSKAEVSQNVNFILFSLRLGKPERCAEAYVSHLFGKAGDENRTHMASLEGWSFTIKLRPLIRGLYIRKGSDCQGII